MKQCWKIFPFCLLQYSQEKVFCEGLTEGKFSFPIIHTITSHPHDSQVISILLFQIHSFCDTPKTLSAALVSVLHLFYSSCDIQHNLHYVANMYKSLIIYIESMNILAMVDPWSLVLRLDILVKSLLARICYSLTLLIGPYYIYSYHFQVS